MKLTPKQKQLVKEYIQTLQSKKLNEVLDGECWINIESSPTVFINELEPEFKIFFKKLPKEVIKKIDDTLTKLYNKKESAIDNGRDYPQSYYSGVNALQNYIVKQFKKINIDVIEEEGDDDTIILKFK